MKLRIKFSNNKFIEIDIEETKTVSELIKQLSQHPHVAESLNTQQITYDGKLLEEKEKLTAYNIDENKFLTIIAPKQPSQEAASQTSTESVAEGVTAKKEKTLEQGLSEYVNMDSAMAAERRAEFIARIARLGFSEEEVRRAMAEYLNEPDDIPLSPSSVGSEYDSDLDGTLPMPVFHYYRSEPAFKRLRYDLSPEPDSLNDVVERMVQTDSSLLDAIDENPQDFLNMFSESYDSDESDEEDFTCIDDIDEDKLEDYDYEDDFDEIENFDIIEE